MLAQVMQQKPFQYHPPQDEGLDILFQDQSLLIVDKPSGLLSVPGRGEDRQDCLLSRLQNISPDALIVHRLDMATSGIMIFARNKAVHRCLSMLFAERAVHKTYIAEVDGLVAEDEGEINQPLMADWPNRPKQKIDVEHGKPSQTSYHVLRRDTLKQTTRLQLTPITGRSHQLRLHMQWLKHPILGDEFYADEASLAKSNRLLLHASSLSLTHPVSQEQLNIQCLPTF